MVPANRVLGVVKGKERIQQEKNWGHTTKQSQLARWHHPSPFCHPPRSLCVCALEFPKIILFPPTPISHVPAPSHLSPLACLSHNKLKNKKPPAISVVLFPATLCLHLFLPLSAKAALWGQLQGRVFPSALELNQGPESSFLLVFEILSFISRKPSLTSLPTHFLCYLFSQNQALLLQRTGLIL